MKTVPAAVDAARPKPESESDAKAATRPDRVGRSNVTAYVTKVTKTQLRILAAERETTIQELVIEALNELFAKHGKPPIAS